MFGALAKPLDGLLPGTPGYDPRALGARCDECILAQFRASHPVGPDIGREARCAVVGEGPGLDEAKQGRPFVGMSGQELDHSLRTAGLKRGEAAVFNAFACKPPETAQSQNDLAYVEKQLAKRNKERAKNGEAPLLHPVEACRPRLLNEIGGYTDVIAVGGKALQGLTGNRTSILSVRGGMLDGWLDDVAMGGSMATRYVAGPAPLTPNGRRIRILPTVHPAFVLRARRWTKVFRADLGRALRWFSGALAWKEPAITYNPDAETLRAFLARHDLLAYDVETDGIEPLTANLRCIGIGSGDEVMLVGLLGIDGKAKFYATDEERRVREVLRDWFANADKIKVGHNAGYYDRLVIEQHFGVTPTPVVDTILLHRLVESELPHNLGFVASLYADISPAWKADRTATTAETDHDLHKYCAYDVALNERILPPLVQHVKLRQQSECFKVDTGVQAACVSMHRNGMYIDQRRREQWEYTLSVRAHDWEARARDIADVKGLNLMSVQQIRDLLYQRWRLPIPDGSNGKPKITKGGDPSTDSEALRTMYQTLGARAKTDPAAARAHAFIFALRRYRAFKKLLGTYVTKLRPWTMEAEDGFDEDDAALLAASFGMSVDDFLENEDEFEILERTAKDRKRQKEKKRGLVDPRTGRVYPSYTSHATVVGRIAGSGPNCFDGATEVLTPAGWVRFDQLPQGVPVAQFWPHTGAVDFAVPLGYVAQPYKGAMYGFRNQHIDLFVTPNHRCLLQNRKTGEFQDHRADAYPEDWRQLNAGIFTGGPGLFATFGVRAPDIVRLLAAVQADANVADQRIDFVFTKARKIERMGALLDRLGVGYTFGARKGPPDRAQRMRFVLHESAVTRAIVALLGPKKLFGPWMLQMSRAEMDAFVDEVWHWDGHAAKRTQYASQHEVNASWVQTLCALSNVRGHTFVAPPSGAAKLDSYQVMATWRRPYSLTTNIGREVVDYDGMIYCVSMPSKYVMVRRNGKISMTGQTLNVPADLRDMFTAAPGNRLVGADMDQLHMRIAAARWNIQRYLDAFAKGADPHAATALSVFGAAFKALKGIPPGHWDGDFFIPHGDGKWGKPAKGRRDVSKRVCYSGLYKATPETQCRVIRATEEADGTLPYADMDVPQVRIMRDAWLQANPEIPAGWEAELAFYRKHGYGVEPVLGRRRDYLDGENENEIINFPILGAEAGLMGRSTTAVNEEFPAAFAGHGTGLINQNYDSMVLEVPAALAEHAAKRLEALMTQTEATLPGVIFSAAAKIGMNWKEV